MKLKIYITISILFAYSFKLYAGGVSPLPPTEYYMFSVYTGENQNDRHKKENIAYWKQYMQNKVNDSDIESVIYEMSYWQFSEAIKSDNSKYKFISYLNKIGDQEALEYLLTAKLYEKARAPYDDPWFYPTKDDLKHQMLDIETICNNASEYKGEKFKERYSLQIIRVYFLQKEYDKCLKIWDEEIRHKPNSYIKEMSKSYIATIWFRRGEYSKAIEHYAAVGDMYSLKWCAQKTSYSLLDMIKNLYNTDSNASGLQFMIQRFINEAESTTHYYKSRDVLYRQETEDWALFIDFAERVVKENRTNHPALWQSAIAYLTYLMGESKSSFQLMKYAESMRGTPQMKDNIKALKLLILSDIEEENNHEIAILLEWLIEKAKKTKFPHFTQSPDYERRNHYTDVLRRVILVHLAPTYLRRNDNNIATGLMGVVDEITITHCGRSESPLNREEDYYYGNEDYSFSFSFEHLDTISVSKVIAYRQYLNSTGGTKLDQIIRKNCYKNSEYYNELIGTKYIRIEEFENAIKHLTLVSEKFVTTQNIAKHLVNINPFKESWIYGQQAQYHDTKNRHDIKLWFSKEMLAIKNEIEKTKDPIRKSQLLYQYAIGLYQSSHVGQCWAICHYGHGTGSWGYIGWSLHRKEWESTWRTNNNDFINNSLCHLKEAEKTSDKELAAKCFYARLAIERGGTLMFDELINNYQNTSFFNDVASKCALIKNYMKL